MKRHIIRLLETDSTNSYLREHGVAGDGMTVAVTGYQTAGRGQGTNCWESEAGKNLLMSVFVPLIPPADETSMSCPSEGLGEVSREVVIPNRQFILSEAGALAVGRALSHYTDGITLKWPNDIYWHDYKISGTLIETTVGGGGLRSSLFGIGINVNQTVFRSDAPNPVSLAQILGHEVSVEEVMERVLDALDEELTAVFQGQAADVRARYHAALYRREGFHDFRDDEGSFEAEIMEVEDEGHLILRDSKGRLRSYAFKEVEFMI